MILGVRCQNKYYKMMNPIHISKTGDIPTLKEILAVKREIYKYSHSILFKNL